MNDKDNFKIENGILVEYTGKDKEVTIPEGVTEIGVAAFDIACVCSMSSFPKEPSE